MAARPVQVHRDRIRDLPCAADRNTAVLVQPVHAGLVAFLDALCGLGQVR